MSGKHRGEDLGGLQIASHLTLCKQMFSGKVIAMWQVVLLWTSASYIEVSRFQSQLCSQFQLSVHVTHFMYLISASHLRNPDASYGSWLWPGLTLTIRGHLESELGKGDICLSLYLLFLKIIRHK